MNERKDNISWDDYFMGIAKLTALRSKDPNTQVGSCIVNSNNIIISTGYNGFPRGISDKLYNWGYKDTGNGTKYDFVVHAELNSILNSIDRDLHGATLYTTLLPCSECAKAIIQSGIIKVIYEFDISNRDFNFNLTKKLFRDANIELKQYTSNLQIILNGGI